MTKNEIIDIVKEHYSRDIRKQLVKSLLTLEREDRDLTLEKPYIMINQIFSYVLQESGWKLEKNSATWNAMPLEIMLEAFPQLSSTKWYKAQCIETTREIDVITEKK